jgi:hypothetical protein
MDGMHIHNGNSIEEREANAKLISCAPEMLEALIEQVADGMMCEECKKCSPPCVDKHSIKLIEKATGMKWEEICE